MQMGREGRERKEMRTRPGVCGSQGGREAAASGTARHGTARLPFIPQMWAPATSPFIYLYSVQLYRRGVRLVRLVLVHIDVAVAYQRAEMSCCVCVCVLVKGRKRIVHRRRRRGVAQWPPRTGYQPVQPPYDASVFISLSFLLNITPPLDSGGWLQYLK